MESCIFCKIIEGKIPSQKVYEDKNLFAFRDVSPQAPVHILIVPKKHIETLLELGEEHSELIGRIHLTANHIARKEGIAERGFRLVVNCKEDGGQTVFHLHYHLLGGRAMAWPPG
ncbi:MAG: histidine triad nucleotide-binding protein [bacterium]|nr:histidine triad nucleotide-binding protein [bacterium]